MRAKMLAAAAIMIMVKSQALADEWREGDALMLNVRSTVACELAPMMREWHRMVEDGRVVDAFRFAITYCQKIVWAPVPLFVMYEDDMSGEQNPGVCVRQINWRSCMWIAREHLKPFDGSILRAPDKAP